MDLLGAMGGGNPDCLVRRIDVVMGPDTARPDIRRVKALAESRHSRRLLTSSQPERVVSGPASDKRYLWVEVQPLFAEDFIADYFMRLQNFRSDGVEPEPPRA